MNSKARNEKLKRVYFKRLRLGKGYSEATVVAHERALSKWEEYTGYEDLGRFTANKAVSFKRHLEQADRKGSMLSASSRYQCLRCLMAFFDWLSQQPGYKSKINADAISYLALDQKTVTAVTSTRSLRVPSLEYVKRLTSSIEIRTEVDRRDRALISFLLLSGMRDKAVATLPLGFFDRDKLEIKQDYLHGVDTKFGKSFVSCLVVFDDQLMEYFLNWVDFLRSDRLFANTDPLFPRTKVAQAIDSLAFEATEVEPIFWRSTGSIRAILRDRAESAGLEYYYPHSFRHAHAHLALPFAQTAEQVKAISQNLGHEHVNTTLTTYGKLDAHRVGEVIRGMSFAPREQAEITETDLKMLAEIVRKTKKRS